MVKPTSGAAPWEASHTTAAVTAMVELILQNRSSIYANPALHNVNNNGGDRINKKMQQILRKMLEDAGVQEAGKVLTELAKKNGRKRDSTRGPSPKQVTPKKRKAAKESDEEGDVVKDEWSDVL